MLEKLSCESFADKEGQHFTLQTPAGVVELTLLHAKPIEKSAKEEEQRPAVEGRPQRQPFSLLFAGPKDRELYDGVYSLTHKDLGSMENIYFQTVVVEGEKDQPAEALHVEAVFG